MENDETTKNVPDKLKACHEVFKAGQQELKDAMEAVEHKAEILEVLAESKRIIGVLKRELDELKAAIRRGDSLKELRYQAGPTSEQQEQSAARLARLDAIWQRCEREYGSDRVLWPMGDQLLYTRLEAEQGAFESDYC